MRRTGATVLAVLAVLASCALAGANVPSADGMRGQYLSQIDQWVAAGGPQDRYRLDVVTMCQKLMYLRATGAAGEEKELDRRVEACTRLTLHRLSPQPEFARAQTRRAICRDLARVEPVFVKLCRDAGIAGAHMR